MQISSILKLRVKTRPSHGADNVVVEHRNAPSSVAVSSVSPAIPQYPTRDPWPACIAGVTRIVR